ncbi:MAG: Gfo/Idh/MocA family protein [Lachnospirales bacterium]
MFKFVILGAGNISRKFCDAVSITKDCEVVAVASKSLTRAKEFSEELNIGNYYDDYEEMLIKEQPDCAYIGVVQSQHFKLTMVCAKHKINVLCEKAMFMSRSEAEIFFKQAREEKIFSMEAMWSCFLPSVQKAKEWIHSGRIGKLNFVDYSIGLIVPKDKENRFLNPKLGAGASFDISVYGYHLTRYLVNKTVDKIQVMAKWADTGTDISNKILLKMSDVLVSISSSFEATIKEEMVIYGEEGFIVLPHSHYGTEAKLYNGEALMEHFIDSKTENGFIYEVEEVIKCIEQGCLESSVVPNNITLDCCLIFDMIMDTKYE